MAQQTSTSKAATEPKEIIFEDQPGSLSSSQFYDLFDYVLENGKSTLSIESLSFINASEISLICNDAPDIYTLYFIDGFPVAACDKLEMISWTI